MLLYAPHSKLSEPQNARAPQKIGIPPYTAKSTVSQGFEFFLAYDAARDAARDTARDKVATITLVYSATA